MTQYEISFMAGNVSFFEICSALLTQWAGEWWLEEEGEKLQDLQLSRSHGDHAPPHHTDQTLTQLSSASALSLTTYSS